MSETTLRQVELTKRLVDTRLTELQLYLEICQGSLDLQAKRTSVEDLMSGVSTLLQGSLAKGIFDIKLADTAREIVTDERVVSLLIANLSATFQTFKNANGRMKLQVSTTKEATLVIDWHLANYSTDRIILSLIGKG